MMRVGGLVLVLASLAATGVAILAACACTSFGAAEEAPASEAGSEAAALEAGAGADAGLCAPGAFCDSFDDGQPLPRGWKSVEPSGGAALAIDKDVLVDDPLPFSMSNPSKYGFQFGVSYSTGNAGGSIAFDDVSFLVTPH